MKLLTRKLGYATYDFSNSGYVLMFQSFLFPVYLSELSTESFNLDFWWGIVVASSGIIAAIFAPIVGNLFDRKGKSALFLSLVLFTIVCATFDLLSTSLTLILFFFILFNATFELTQVIYDAYLTVVSNEKKERIEISTFAWGFGYLGGVLFSIIYLLLDKISYSSTTILFVSLIMYGCISFISYLFFKDVEGMEYKKADSNIAALYSSKLSRPPKKILKLIGIIFIIFSSVSAIVYYSSYYAKNELGIDTKTIGMLILMAQTLAFPLTILSGRIAKRIGISKVIQIALVIWLLITIGFSLAHNLQHLIVIMILFAAVIGSTQSLLRAYFSNMIDNSKTGAGELFGYFGAASKIASIVGPLLVSSGVLIFGSIRASFVLLSIIVLVGLLLSRGLKDD